MILLLYYYAGNEKTGTRIPGTHIRPEYSGVYRVVLAPYPTRIRSFNIRVLPVSVPNIKIPEFVSEKTGICTIRIWYPMGIPDPFSPLVEHVADQNHVVGWCDHAVALR
jgi:hypothetical protein